MPVQNNWVIGEQPFSSGGQGKVFEARRRTDYILLSEKLQEITNKLGDPTLKVGDHIEHAYRDLFDIVQEFYIPPQKLFAFKSFTPRQGDNEKMFARFRNEIEAWRSVKHDSIAELVDYGDDKDSPWYVTPLFSKGSLMGHLPAFKGNCLGSLQAIRPLVEAVSLLHTNKYQHRDIKPANIMVSDSGCLKLIDFGIVYVPTEVSRVTDTLENVGSWRWMPHWATGRRVDDPDDTFDVFALGRVLWSMVEGRDPVDSEYGYTKGQKLTDTFPGRRDISFVDNIVHRCVVHRQEECLKSCKELLGLIDEAIDDLSGGPRNILRDKTIPCGICRNGALTPTEMSAGFSIGAVKGYICSNCGNIQFFSAKAPTWSSRRATI